MMDHKNRSCDDQIVTLVLEFFTKTNRQFDYQSNLNAHICNDVEVEGGLLCCFAIFALQDLFLQSISCLFV